MRSQKYRQSFMQHLFFTPIICILSNIYAASWAALPAKKWQTATPEEQGISSEVLVKMMKHIGKNQYKIDTIIIARNGRILLDTYFLRHLDPVIFPFLHG